MRQEEFAKFVEEFRLFLREFDEFKGKVETKLEQIHSPSDCELVKKLNDNVNQIKGHAGAFKIIMGFLQALWGILIALLYKLK
jgi:mRNA-degrading endonuclease RelE of RelBE toxin-antitoxin system